MLAPAFNPAGYNPERVQRVYIGGLAAGTMARLFTDAYGPIPIDGAELDRRIIEVGRRYFDMNEPNLIAVALDARHALRESPYTYDIIALDAYRPPYIPFHLTTVEFFVWCGNI
jgi:spermidine synthase